MFFNFSTPRAPAPKARTSVELYEGPAEAAGGLAAAASDVNVQEGTYSRLLNVGVVLLKTGELAAGRLRFRANKSSSESRPDDCNTPLMSGWELSTHVPGPGM